MSDGKSGVAPRASPEAAAAAAATPASGGTSSGKCDVCGFGRKHVGSTPVQCVQCNLLVHKECYGMTNMTEYAAQEFTCLACAAVGKKFQAVEVWKKTGVDEDRDQEQEYEKDRKARRNFNTNIVLVKQRSRPRCCAFCSVSDGNHAMHPLFDNHGSRGRRVFKRDSKDKKELIWAHTLCAMILSSSVYGLSYGCLADGTYESSNGTDNGDDESDDEPDPSDELDYRNKDDRPTNPELMNISEFTSMYGECAIHHYRCYLRPTWGWTENEGGRYGWLSSYTESITRFQEELAFCTICGESDKKKNVPGKYMNLRFPIQCKANDDDEFEGFKTKHCDAADCYLSFHVGCARWGGMNPKNLRRVYFFPGDENNDEIACLYCNRHAEDLDEGFQKNRERSLKKERSQNAQRKKKEEQQRKKTREHVNRQAERRNEEDRLIQQERKRMAKARAEKERSAAVKKASRQTDSSRGITGVLNPTTSKRPPSDMKDNDSSSLASSSSKKLKEGVPAGKERTAPPRSRYYTGPKDRYTSLDRTDAVAVNKLQKPTLSKKRRELADQNSSAKKKDGDANDIADYLLAKSKNATGRFQILSDNDFMPARKHWKRELSHLSSLHFMEIWERASSIYHRKLSEMMEGVPRGIDNESGFVDNEGTETPEETVQDLEDPAFQSVPLNTSKATKGNDITNNYDEQSDSAADDMNGTNLFDVGDIPSVQADCDTTLPNAATTRNDAATDKYNLFSLGEKYFGENFILPPWRIVDPKDSSLD